jgi:hypothetical protein
MKYVFWTRALNTQMQIKYQEISNGSPKFGGMWKEYRFVQPHNLLFGVELSADYILKNWRLFIPRLRRGEIWVLVSYYLSENSDAF